MKEIFYSIINDIKERIQNKIIGPFVIIWSVYNWDIIVRLFNMNPYTTEMQIVTVENNLNIIDGLWWPLFYLVIYLFVFPWFNYYVFKSRGIVDSKYHQLNFQRKKHKINLRSKILDERITAAEKEKEIIKVEGEVKKKTTGQNPNIKIFEKLDNIRNEINFRGFRDQVSDALILASEMSKIQNYINHASSTENRFKSDELNNLHTDFMNSLYDFKNLLDRKFSLNKVQRTYVPNSRFSQQNNDLYLEALSMIDRVLIEYVKYRSYIQIILDS